MKRALVIFGLVVVLSAVCSAEKLTYSEMSAIVAKSCCSGTEVSNTCSGSGGGCSECDCGGSYVASGGSLNSCLAAETGGDCSDTSVTCTSTVNCNAGQTINNSSCQGSAGCVPDAGSSCSPCSTSITPNLSTSQSC